MEVHWVLCWIHCFSLYMSNLPAAVKNTDVTMFAKDTRLRKWFQAVKQLTDQLVLGFIKIY